MMTSLLVLSAVLVLYQTVVVIFCIFDYEVNDETLPIMGYPIVSAIFIIILWHYNLPLAIILLAVLAGLNIIRASQLTR